MPTYGYRPYYRYDGPTRSQPFREELTAEQVNENLELFFARLDSHFAGSDAVVTHDSAGTAYVASDTLSETTCDDIVKGLLNQLDLFANKVRQS